MLVSEQIVGHVVQVEREWVVKLVEQAMKRLPTKEPLLVRVHPKDLATLTECQEERWPTQPRWVADPTLHRGGCLVEGPDFGLVRNKPDTDRKKQSDTLVLPICEEKISDDFHEFPLALMFSSKLSASASSDSSS